MSSVLSPYIGHLYIPNKLKPKEKGEQWVKGTEKINLQLKLC